MIAIRSLRCLTLLCVGNLVITSHSFFIPRSRKPRVQPLRVRNTKKPNLKRRRQPSGDLTLMEEENDLKKRGFKYILGSDESGRGSIAGPVVAATCCILVDDYQALPEVGDSKTLTPDKRQSIAQHVIDNPEIYAYAFGYRSSQEIDASDILSASMDAFDESIQGVVQGNNLLEAAMEDGDSQLIYTIVDGKKAPKLRNLKNVSCRPWVKADKEVYTVALASVLAKVEHDRIMMEYHDKYPQYGFDEHFGYQTPAHVDALHKHGALPCHRLSFKALRGRVPATN